MHSEAFLMLKMVVHINHLTKFNISINFRFQCWDRRQTVNLVSARGLVEQSNAAKNNAVDKLAGSAAGRLAGCWLAATAARGCLAGWLLAYWLTGWLLACGCC